MNSYLLLSTTLWLLLQVTSPRALSTSTEHGSPNPDIVLTKAIIPSLSDRSAGPASNAFEPGFKIEGSIGRVIAQRTPNFSWHILRSLAVTLSANDLRELMLAVIAEAKYHPFTEIVPQHYEFIRSKYILRVFMSVGNLEYEDLFDSMWNMLSLMDWTDKNAAGFYGNLYSLGGAWAGFFQIGLDQG